MMDLLDCAGFPPVSDGHRPADEHNPRGYWEDARVLQLAQQGDWLWLCGGRSLKILYRQLYHVPPALPARIVVMHRDLNEVAASQSLMLGQSGQDRDWADLLARDWRRFLGWLQAQQQWPQLAVDYGQLVHEPEPTLQRLLAFLAVEMDVQRLLERVHPDLHRSRCS